MCWCCPVLSFQTVSKTSSLPDSKTSSLPDSKTSSLPDSKTSSLPDSKTSNNNKVQQNRIIKHNREQGRAKVIIRTRDNQRFMVEMQFGINMSSFFWKIAIVSDVFKVMRNSFQTLGAATEKARLPKLSFVLLFGTISCCEIDDLSCLGIFERCRRLAK